MKALYSLPLLIVALSCGNPEQATKAALRSEGASQAELGLNDVSVLLPYDTVPELISSGLLGSDKPDPDAFAPGAEALPLDGESFIPSWVLHAIETELAADRALREQEGLAEDFDWSNASWDDYDIERALRGGFVGNERPGFATRSEKEIFRLVSLRFDPCVNSLHINGNEDACKQQMRFVWQGVRDDRRLIDSNIHAIYELKRDEFRSIVDTLRFLVKESGLDTLKEPLQPQPVIRKQGLSGSYYKGIIGIVHRFARSANLKHIAFFTDTLGGLQGHWPMLKFDVKDNRPLRTAIPGIHVRANEVPKFVQRLDGDRGSLSVPSPLPAAADTLYPEFKVPVEEIDGAEGRRVDPEIVAIKAEHAFRLENPKLHDAANLDCASCHTADFEKRGLSRRRDAVPTVDAYKSSRWNLSVLQTIPDFTSLQMFSFFTGSFRIAPRTINESAEAADRVNALY